MDSSQSQDHLQHSLSPEPSRAKYRARQSCISCRHRKVKCDRVKPCRACCIRGLPSECRYTASGQDRHYISQSAALDRMRTELNRMHDRLAELERQRMPNPSPDPQIPQINNNIYVTTVAPAPTFVPTHAFDSRSSLFKDIVNIIATAPSDVVAHAVDQLRSGAPLEFIVAAAKERQPAPGASFAIQADRPGTQPNRTQSSEHDPLTRTAQGISELDPSNSGTLTVQSWTRQPTRTRTESPHRGLGGWQQFQELFLEKFLSTFAPGHPSRSPTKEVQVDLPWLYALVQNRSSLPQSRNALEGVATAYFGKVTGDSRLSMQSQSIYTATLRMLRRSVNSGKFDWTDTLSTVLALNLFEFISYTSSVAWLNHVHGAEALFQMRGPRHFVSGIDHQAFLHFRLYGIIASHIRMAPSFLARDEWKTIPWSLNPSSKDILHHLLDHLADLSVLMADFARLQRELESGHLSPPELYTVHPALFASLKGFVARLQQWKAQWVDAYPYGQPYEIPQSDERLDRGWGETSWGSFCLPPFICSRGPNPGPASNIYYPDIFLSRAMGIYYATVISIGRLDPLGEVIPDLELYDAACRLCRSCEYNIFFAPGNSGALHSLFPLRVAHFYFQEGSQERAWMDGLFAWMGRSSPLGISSRARPDLIEDVQG